LQQNCCNKLGRLIISLKWNKKLVRFCWTSDFSYTNFVGVRLDSHVNLSNRIWSLEKHSPLISAPEMGTELESDRSRSRVHLHFSDPDSSFREKAESGIDMHGMYGTIIHTMLI